MLQSKYSPSLIWRINSETALLQNRINDHEINNDTRFSVLRMMQQKRVMSLTELDIELYISIAFVDIKTSYYLSETNKL